MKKLLAALCFMAVPAWASYQPITGSTVTVVPPAGQTMAVSGVVSAQGSGTYTITPGSGTLAISGPINVISTNTLSVLSVTGTSNIGTVTGSTVTIVPPAGQTISISGVVNNISTTTAQVSAQQSGTYTITPGTGTLSVLNVTGTSNIGTVTGSTVTVVTSAGQTLSVSGVLNVISTTTAQVSSQQSGTYVVTPGTGIWNASGTQNVISTKTYSYSGFGSSFSASTGTILSAATANYIAAICGNATTTVLVYGVRASCTQTTAGEVSMSVVRTTSPFSGSFGTMTVTADDPNLTVQYSSAVWFQVNPTNPTLQFNSYYIDSVKMGCMATATATANDIYINPTAWFIKPKILRAASQCIAVTLNNTTVTGGNFSIGFDWIETTANP